MKNVHFVQNRPFIRIPMHGAPPLTGWAIRLLQDIPEGDFKEGYWMDHWTEVQSQGQIDFQFTPELYMVFTEEAKARHICDFLRSEAAIETAVVKIGNPQ
jgi:hypothetical protein